MHTYSLLPFRFEKLNGRFFVANEVGEFIFLPEEKFHQMVQGKLDSNDPTFLNLKAKHILTDTDIEPVIDMLAVKYRTKKSFLNNFTSLHMVVPTLCCNSKCIYCQASSRNEEEKQYNMNKETAKKIVETIFKTPSANIKIEFQGGEPLLNFEIVKYIVKYTQKINAIIKKSVQFVVCTNLTLIDKGMLLFFKKHNVYLSTSLDGPKELHNNNRRFRNQQESYDIFIDKLKLAQKIIGRDKISALMTTTKAGIAKLPEVIDEYILHGFTSIFLRMMNPYGQAAKNRINVGYNHEEFVEAYKNALNYIIELNVRGLFFVEEFASILLKKILTPFATGFVDLQSPAGIGISGVIYNYNGDVYVSDEGRMLAEMGDKKFLMGNVYQDTYKEMFCGDYLKSLIKQSCLECLPFCSTCAYQTYCGTDPVRNYVEQGDIIGNRTISGVCKKNKAIIQYLLELIEKNNPDVMDVFWSWITNRSLREIRLTN